MKVMTAFEILAKNDLQNRSNHRYEIHQSRPFCDIFTAVDDWFSIGYTEWSKEHLGLSAIDFQKLELPLCPAFDH